MDIVPIHPDTTGEIIVACHQYCKIYHFTSRFYILHVYKLKVGCNATQPLSPIITIWIIEDLHSCFNYLLLFKLNKQINRAQNMRNMRHHKIEYFL